METATLGGGCFWCLEAVYDEMEGVSSVESGYVGGHLADPDYGTVCTGKTGHVEVVRKWTGRVTMPERSTAP